MAELFSRAAQKLIYASKHPVKGSLYFELLPPPLRDLIDQYLTINSWRYGGVLTKQFSLQGIQRRFVLHSGEEVLIGTFAATADTLQIIYPDRKPASGATVAGHISRFTPPSESFPDPLLLTYETALPDGSAINLYSHAGVCVARQSVDSQPPYVPDHIENRWRGVHLLTSHWVQVGAFVYRLPRMSDPLPMPPLVCPATSTNRTVFGEFGQERLAAVAWSSKNDPELCTAVDKDGAVGHLQVWDLRTSKLMFTIATPTVRAAAWLPNAELRIAIISPIDLLDTHRIYSLLDGSLLVQLTTAGNQVCVANGRLWFANESKSQVTCYQASNNSVRTYSPPSAEYCAFVHCIKTRVLKYFHIKEGVKKSYLLDVASGRGVEVPFASDHIHSPWFHSDAFFFVTIKRERRWVFYMACIESCERPRKILKIPIDLSSPRGWPINAVAPFNSSAHGPFVVIVSESASTLYRCQPTTATIANVLAMQQ